MTRIAKSKLFKHGMEPVHLFWVWQGMLRRCRWPKDVSYKYYGARGIEVCPAWRDFRAFRDWALVNGWQKGLHIDRRDNDGDYSPDNSRIVTAAVNQRNRRKPVRAR